jgi:hypothetical protein
LATLTPPQDGRAHRLNALAALLALGLVLYVARLLAPDPRGYGTHEHLYLPPCLFHTITHIPCPFCGMTTGFAHMARGEVVEAARSNPGAPLLYVLTCIGAIAALRAVIFGGRVLPLWAAGRIASRALVTAITLLWAIHIGCVLYVPGFPR